MNTAINTGDTAWLLTSIAFVLLMTPGVAFFYGGLVRGKNVLNTMMMSVISMGIVALLWAGVGYSLAFGKSNGWIGSFEHVGLAGIDLSVYPGTNIPMMVFVLFQMTFAVITPALISGAVVERMRFSAYALFISLWSLIVYPLVSLGMGWRLDCRAWGARLCRWYGRPCERWRICGGGGSYSVVEKDSDEPKPHNVPFVILGGSLLWFGWFGFNGGSNGRNAYGLALSTNLAAAAAMVCWTLLEWRSHGRPSAVGAMIGAVVGLVTITPAAGFVTPLGAIAMGAIGSVAAFYAIKLLGRSRIDDSLDVFACHGVGGIVGSILTGFFATTTVNADGTNGLFYGRLVSDWHSNINGCGCCTLCRVVTVGLF